MYLEEGEQPITTYSEGNPTPQVPISVTSPAQPLPLICHFVCSSGQKEEKENQMVHTRQTSYSGHLSHSRLPFSTGRPATTAGLQNTSGGQREWTSIDPSAMQTTDLMCSRDGLNGN